MSETVRIEPQALRDCVKQIFVSAGIPAEQAEKVAIHLVESDMVGHPSHGVQRIRWYLDEIAIGGMRPLADIQPLRATPSNEVWAVNKGLGIVAAERAMRRAVAMARERTLALVAVRNASHCGRLGAFSVIAAQDGCLGLMFLNGGARFAAPFGSGVRRLPPNPLAFSAPFAERQAITVDISASASAVGKAQVAALEGRPLPVGYLVDEAGEDATDAAAFLRGELALRPLGGALAGHKGFGLAMMVEALAGALSGAGVNQHDEKRGNGFSCLAIHIESFLPLAEFHADMRALLAWVKDAPPLPGQEGVLYPGEPEERARQQAQALGVPLSAAIWQLVGECAAEQGVDLPAPA